MNRLSRCWLLRVWGDEFQGVVASVWFACLY